MLSTIAARAVINGVEHAIGKVPGKKDWIVYGPGAVPKATLEWPDPSGPEGTIRRLPSWPIKMLPIYVESLDSWKVGSKHGLYIELPDD